MYTYIFRGLETKRQLSWWEVMWACAILIHTLFVMQKSFARSSKQTKT